MKRVVTGRNSCLLLLIFLTGLACDSTPASNPTIYTKTANSELKQQALQVVKSIRALVDAYNTKDRELRAASDKQDTPTLKPEAKKALRDQWLAASDAAHDAAMRSYRAQYWAEAIVLRNELSKRLPKHPKQNEVAAIYHNPTNVLGIQLIADHLELSAKSLSDSS